MTDPAFTDAAGPWLEGARRVASPNQDDRPSGDPVCLIVIHSISLPPGQFGGAAIEQLFTNCLDPLEHPYFHEVHGLRVSAHFLIRRDGELVQFVATSKRAWHAGVSCWHGREGCNDISIGIELEGDDAHPFNDTQYASLGKLVCALRGQYPIEAVVGHADIAPGRKTDPGPWFDWRRLAALSDD